MVDKLRQTIFLFERWSIGLSNKEEEYLINEATKNEVKTPLFEAPDGKILAVGDLFRGPSTGITSDIDLNNPGRKLEEPEVKLD